MILSINCGSQSIKWKLFGRGLKLKKRGNREVFDANNYEKILEEELHVLEKYKAKIKKIGHRFVNGGGKYRKPTKITENVINDLSKLKELAPLHNPYNLLGIIKAKDIFKNIEQIAVFDTELFINLPEKAREYALPEDIREKYGFKRMGFHGISHEFAAKEGAKLIGKSYHRIKIISCHFGGGASIAAIKNGKAMDISMGFSPLEGLPMMTRSGSLDPQIILDLCKDLGVNKVKEILNKESGLKGICGESNMLDLLKKTRKGDKKAKLAFDMFVYSAKKYIGAYYAILGKCDLVVFTGTVGAGEAKTRKQICKDLDILKNTKVIAIKADEELAIAKKL